METRNLEQRCTIKFCVKLDENATETCEKLKRAYGEHALSTVQVFRWHNIFLDGRESVGDEPRSGRPCTSKTDEHVTKVRAVVRSDRHLTVGMVGSELNLNHRTVHDILTEELGMQKICVKLVPENLTHEQKENRRNVCLDVLESIEKGISVVLQPSYSPYLSPCDFFFFPKLKFHFKGRHFGTVGYIQKIVTDQLRALTHENFQHCYRE